jgi:hypothetical protein
MPEGGTCGLAARCSSQVVRENIAGGYGVIGYASYT